VICVMRPTALFAIVRTPVLLLVPGLGLTLDGLGARYDLYQFFSDHSLTCAVIG
jgi:hypothetical protein